MPDSASEKPTAAVNANIRCCNRLGTSGRWIIVAELIVVGARGTGAHGNETRCFLGIDPNNPDDQQNP